MQLKARAKALYSLLRPTLPTLARDSAGLAGLGSIAFGCHMAWAPGGWIVLGLELVAVSLLTAKANAVRASEAAA